MSRILLAGASGETGKLVLANLLADTRVEKVTTLVRKPLPIEHEKLNQIIANYDNLDQEVFKEHDVGVCCLGTTRAKSGAEGFYKVDHDYVMSVAENCKEAGCSQFHLLSSQGANKDAYFLYTKTKGIVDEKVLNMGFQRAVVYRPALLLVDREERRVGESVAQWLFSWMDRSRSMSVRIEDVGLTMAQNIFSEDTRSIFTNEDIVNEAKKY